MATFLKGDWRPVIWGMCLVLAFYSEAAAVTITTPPPDAANPASCDMLAVCMLKIELFQNHTVCRKMQDALDCLKILRATCPLLFQVDYQYNDDDNDDNTPPPDAQTAHGRDVIGEGDEYSYRYYDDAGAGLSMVALIEDVQRNYNQNCGCEGQGPNSTAVSVDQDNNHSPGCHASCLLLLMLTVACLPLQMLASSLDFIPS